MDGADEGSSDADSCLVKNLSYYVELSLSDRKLIAAFEKEERQYKAGEIVHPANETSRHLYAVRTGWAFLYTVLHDGRRQIIRTFVPGDVIGLAELASKTTSFGLAACGDAVLCPFEKSALRPVVRRSPRLAAMLLALSARDQMVYMDLLGAIGRMAAIERVMFVLLTWRARLAVTLGKGIGIINCRLNQTELGDLLGLTNVSISKALGELERHGFISREGSVITLLKLEEMAEATDFSDRYDTIDTSWFPPLEAGERS